MRTTLDIELVRKMILSKASGRERNGVPLFPVKSGARVVTMDLINRLRDEASTATP